jgi:hypothetical protein
MFRKRYSRHLPSLVLRSYVTADKGIRSPQIRFLQDIGQCMSHVVLQNQSHSTKIGSCIMSLLFHWLVSIPADTHADNVFSQRIEPTTLLLIKLPVTILPFMAYVVISSSGYPRPSCQLCQVLAPKASRSYGKSRPH